MMHTTKTKLAQCNLNEQFTNGHVEAHYGTRLVINYPKLILLWPSLSIRSLFCEPRPNRYPFSLRNKPMCELSAQHFLIGGRFSPNKDYRALGFLARGFCISWRNAKREYMLYFDSTENDPKYWKSLTNSL